MADDPRYRSQRPDPYRQDRASRPESGPKDDPLAELARLIGQDEAFIAASREGARTRPRDPQREPDRDASAPNWLARAGQHPDHGRDEAATYEAETDRQGPGYFSDLELETGRRSRQPRASWETRSEEDESRYGGFEQDTRQDRHEPRYDPHDPRRNEDIDPYRVAAQDDRYDRLPQAAEGYDDGTGPAPQINPFDPRHDHVDHAEDDDRHASRLRRRGGILTVAAVVGLAAVGTAAAFGYRAWTAGSSTTGQPPLIKADTAPTKVVPAQVGDGQQNKLIYDRIGEKIQSSNDRMVSREEQPLEPREMPRQPGTRSVLPAPGTPGSVTIGAQPPAYAAPPAPPVGNPGPDEPKRVRTTIIRPDQVSTLPAPGEPSPARSVTTTNVGPTAAPAAPASRSAAPAPAPAPKPPSAPKPASSAPLALNPSAEAPPPNSRSGTTPAQPAPYRTAALPGGAEAGNYVVQISSQRSETEAQASFRALQAKYPNVLGSRQPLIRRADLGSKGVYYRAQVGPFATADDANQLCGNLKAAGGQCIVQRN
jgi:SPOR domain